MIKTFEVVACECSYLFEKENKIFYHEKEDKEKLYTRRKGETFYDW